MDVPTPISLPATMKLYIESVCAGHSHNIALTNVGVSFYALLFIN